MHSHQHHLRKKAIEVDMQLVSLFDIAEDSDLCMVDMSRVTTGRVPAEGDRSVVPKPPPITMTETPKELQKDTSPQIC